MEGHLRAKEADWATGLLTLPGENWSSPGKRDQETFMRMKLNRKVGNDVNGAPHQRMRSVASGRSGIDGATQVVNKRNPCATEQIFGCKEQTYVGTWNVRTLYATGQLEILIHQMKDVNWSILGLSEVRWTGEGEINKEDYKIIYSGRTDDRHQDGVALIITRWTPAAGD